MNRYVQWAIVVALNTVIGFMYGIAISQSFLAWVGMILGVITWYIIYVTFDKYLIRTGAHHASKKLMLCALFRAPIQITFVVDICAMIFAKHTVEGLRYNRIQSDLIEFYLHTVFTGLYLSIICAMIYIILSVFIKKEF